MGALVMRKYPVTLSSWFDSIFDSPSFGAERESMYSLAPRMDIFEEENHYFIKTDLPGLNKEDVSITVEKGVIKIEGESKEERKGKCHQNERVYGRFSRAFSLPDDIDASKIEAKMNNGVLELMLPKNEKAKAISVKIN